MIVGAWSAARSVHLLCGFLQWFTFWSPDRLGSRFTKSYKIFCSSDGGYAASSLGRDEPSTPTSRERCRGVPRQDHRGPGRAPCLKEILANNASSLHAALGAPWRDSYSVSTRTCGNSLQIRLFVPFFRYAPTPIPRYSTWMVYVHLLASFLVFRYICGLRVCRHARDTGILKSWSLAANVRARVCLVCPSRDRSTGHVVDFFKREGYSIKLRILACPLLPFRRYYCCPGGGALSPCNRLRSLISSISSRRR